MYNTIKPEVSLSNSDSRIFELEKKISDLEKKLKESEISSAELENFALIMKSCPEAVISFDKGGLVRTWNDSAERIFGYSREEVIGKHISISHFLPENFLKDLSSLINTPLVSNRGVSSKRKDGSEVWVTLNLSLIKNDKEELQGFLAIVKDIPGETEAGIALKEENKELEKINQNLFQEIKKRKKIEDELLAEKEFFEIMVSGSVDGIFALDQNLNYTAWNDFMENYSGRTKEVVIGKNLYQVFPETKNTKETIAILEALTGKKTKLQDRRYLKPAIQGVYDTYIKPIYNAGNEIKGVLGVVHDVTQRTLAEEDIKKNQNLLTSVLNSALNGIVVFKSIREKNEIMDFEYLLINKYSENFLGRKNDELKGKKFFEEFPKVREVGFFEKFRSVVETGTPLSMEYFFEGDGLKNWFQFQAVKLEDGFVLTYQDITPRKVAEEENKSKTNIINSILKNLPVVIGKIDRQGISREAMGLGLQNLGMKDNEIVGTSIYENYSYAKEMLQRAFDGENVSFIGRKLKNDRYFQNYFFADSDKEHVITFSIDITEQIAAKEDIAQKNLLLTKAFEGLKNAEENLKRLNNELEQKVEVRTQELLLRELEYKTLVLASSDSIWSTDPEGNSLEMPVWEEYTGQSRKESINAGWAKAIHPEDREETIRKWETAVKSKGVFEQEYRVRGKDGNFRYFFIRGVPLLNEKGEIKKWIGTFADIDKQRKVLEALKASEAQYRFLTEFIPQMVWTSNAEGIFEYTNTWMCDYLGFIPTDLKSDQGINYIHLDDIARVQKAYENALSSGEALRIEYRIKRGKDGAYLWHLCKSLPFKDEKGKILKWLGVATDIQDQKIIEQTLRDNQALKEVEKSLRMQKEFSESLLDSSADGIYAFDKDVRITAWNKTIEKNTGIKKSDAIGKILFDLFPAYKNSEDGELILTVLKGERFVVPKRPYKVIKAGFYEADCIPLFDKDNNVVGGLNVIRDITERVRLEEENTNHKLTQQKKVLTAILQTQEEERKRIAESLHNGVGQLLYAVKLHMENLISEDMDSKVAQEHIQSLLEEAIKETRTLSFELMPTILEDFGLETALRELFKRIQKTNLKIDFRIEGFEARLPADMEIALYRVIQELINNVIKHSEASQIKIILSNDRNKILLMLSDNGVGFDFKNVIREKRGIGLTSIQNRIKLLNGVMYVDSTSGKGTKINIEIE